MSNKLIKIVSGFLAAAVLAGGVCAAGYASRNNNGKWFANGDLKSWHWSDKTIEDDTNKGDKPSGGDDNGDNKGDKPSGGDNSGDKPSTGDGEPTGGAVVSDGEYNGISILSAVLPVSAYAANDISPLADTAFTFTATVVPSGVKNKQVDYSIAWKNPSSEWASGKDISDYLVLAQSGNGGLTATLTCKQAFGEQAIVTVASRAVSSVKATANVDYRKKLLSSTSGIFDGNAADVKSWDIITNSGTLLNSDTTFTDNFGVGTLDDTVLSHKMRITTSSSLRTALSNTFRDAPTATYTAVKEYDGKNVGAGSVYHNGALWWENLFCPPNGATNGWGEIEGLFSFCTDDEIDYGEWEIIPSMYNKLLACLDSAENDFVITVVTELKHGGTHAEEYYVNVSEGSVSDVPTDLTLDNSSVIF